MPLFLLRLCRAKRGPLLSGSFLPLLRFVLAQMYSGTALKEQCLFTKLRSAYSAYFMRCANLYTVFLKLRWPSYTILLHVERK